MAFLEWCETGTDNWQEVSPSDYISEHGRGYIHIKESWFVGKPPYVCFRLDIKLIDHRGFVPDSLYRKTGDAVDALNWVAATFPGGVGSFSISEGISKEYRYQSDGRLCDTGPVLIIDNFVKPLPAILNPPAGQVYWGWVKHAQNEACDGTAYMRVSASRLGLPLPMQMFPDGTTIDEARVEVTAGGLERQHRLTVYASSGGELITTTDILETDTAGVTATLLGISPGGGYTVLASFPAGTPNRTTVVDATAAMQAMLASRGQYVGYGIVVFPAIAAGLTGHAAFDALLGDPPNYFHPYNDDACRLHPDREEWTDITWDNIDLGTVHLRVTYPNGDSRDIVVPRWPVLD